MQCENVKERKTISTLNSDNENICGLEIINTLAVWSENLHWISNKFHFLTTRTILFILELLWFEHKCWYEKLYLIIELDTKQSHK